MPTASVSSNLNITVMAIHFVHISLLEYMYSVVHVPGLILYCYKTIQLLIISTPPLTHGVS